MSCDLQQLRKDLVKLVEDSGNSNLSKPLSQDGRTEAVAKVDEAIAQLTTLRADKDNTAGYRAKEGETVNHSGGALGADTTWGKVGEQYGVRSNHYYEERAGTDKPTEGNAPISAADIAEGKSKVNKAGWRVGVITPGTTINNSLLNRNWAQVKYADAIFAVTPITKEGDKPGRFNSERTGKVDDRVAKEPTGSGGTLYAIEMAKDAGKPIHIFDEGQTNQWYKWDYTKEDWVQEPTPTLTANFAGIGSRHITAKGEAAIADVYDKTMGVKPIKKSAPLVVKADAVKFNSKTAEKWLSNMHNFAVPIKDTEGNSYYSAEAYYQAMKTDNMQERAQLTKKNMTAAEMKAIGKKLTLRPDWDKNKDSVMREAHRQKFENNPELATKLRETGNKQLVEAVYWKDDGYWGYNPDTKVGQNTNGKLLEEARSKLPEAKAEPVVSTQVSTDEALKMLENGFEEKELGSGVWTKAKKQEYNSTMSDVDMELNDLAAMAKMAGIETDLTNTPKLGQLYRAQIEAIRFARAADGDGVSLQRELHWGDGTYEQGTSSDRVKRATKSAYKYTPENLRSNIVGQIAEEIGEVIDELRIEGKIEYVGQGSFETLIETQKRVFKVLRFGADTVNKSTGKDNKTQLNEQLAVFNKEYGTDLKVTSDKRNSYLFVAMELADYMGRDAIDTTPDLNLSKADQTYVDDVKTRLDNNEKVHGRTITKYKRLIKEGAKPVIATKEEYVEANPVFDGEVMGSMTFDEQSAGPVPVKTTPTQSFNLGESFEWILNDASERDAGFVPDEHLDYLFTVGSEYQKMLETFGIDQEFTLEQIQAAQNLQQEQQIEGSVNVNKGDIQIDLGNRKDFKGETETILHEMQHVLIEMALRNSPKLKKQIRKLRKQLAKGTDYKMFLQQGYNGAQEQYAKDLYEYIFHNPNFPESEFLAYASTNYFMRKALSTMTVKDDVFGTFDLKMTVNPRTGRAKKGFKYHMLDLVNKLIEIVNMTVNGVLAGGKKGDEASLEIVKQLLEISAKASKAKTLPAAPKGKYAKKYMEAEETVTEYIDRMTSGKRKVRPGRLNVRKAESINEWLDRITDIRGVAELKGAMIRNNVFNSIVRDTTDKDKAWFFDMFRQTKQEIDSTIQELKHETFSALLTPDEGEGLDVFLSTDPKTGIQDESILQSLKAGVLNTDYRAITENVTDLLPFLDNVQHTKSEIRKIAGKHGMDAKTIRAAERLGIKLARGVDTDVNGFINALEIRRQFMPNSDAATIAAIDKIASLYAVVYTDAHDRKVTADAIRFKPDVVQGAMNVYYANRNDMRERVYKGREILEEKGFHVKHKDGNKVQYIVTEEQLKSMEREGLKIMHKSDTLTATEKTLQNMTGKRYYVVAGTDLETAYTQGLINTVQIRSEGISLKRILREAEMAPEDITKKIEDLANMSPVGTKPGDNMMTPERDMSGKIIDYKIRSSYKEEHEFMNLNDNLAHVIANTAANLSHKETAITSNIKAVNAMMKYANETYKGNEKKFVILRPSTDEERNSGKEYKYAKDWNMIPDYARKHIVKETGSASIKIPQELLVDFIGYKDVSVTNIKWFETHPGTKKVVRRIEQGIQEIAGAAKKTIVTKMASTIIGNNTSNMAVTMLKTKMITEHGIPNAKMYASKFTDTWENLNTYQATKREIIRLEVEMKKGKPVPPNRIESLRQELLDNPADALMKDGQYSSILEDIDLDFNKDSGMLKEWLDSGMQKLPQGARDLKEAIYLDDKTVAYKKLVKLTQYSDIINRIIIHEHNLEQGMDNTQSLREVDQIFVNYSYLDNKYVKYVNDMTFVMFTKYMSRSLAAMGKFLKHNPLTVGFFLVANKELGVNIPTPFDSYFDPTSSMMNKFKGDDAVDTTLQALFPWLFYLD